MSLQQEDEQTQTEGTPSALVILNQEAVPKLRSTTTPWILGLPFILGLVLCAIAYMDALHSPFIMALLVIAVIAAFAALWHISNGWEQMTQDTVCLVQESRIELIVLTNQLSEYLQRLDTRAPKYFNYVTNTKVSAYFTLIQIKNALEERLSLIEKFLMQESNPALISAYKCLQQPLEFNASVIANTAPGRSVPITDLERYVNELADQLETVFADIEKHIKIEQECEYYDDDTPTLS